MATCELFEREGLLDRLARINCFDTVKASGSARKKLWFM